MTQPSTSSPGVRVISPHEWGDDLGLITGGVWREIVGARVGAACRSLYHLRLAAGAASVPLVHDGEAVYYVIDGAATFSEIVEGTERATHELPDGGMVHVRPAARYRISARSGATLVGGPSPVDTALGDERAASAVESTSPDGGITTYHRDRPGLRVPFISADARLVVWLGEGAVTANMNYVVLQPGERNREHVHAFSEDTIHVLEGQGTAENVTTGERLPFGPGDTIHIEIGFWHAIAADRGERVVSVGGPCPADTDMLRAVGVDVDALTARLAST